LTEGNKELKCIAVVRIRGTVRAQREVRETLQMLHLTKNNYAVLIENSPSFVGMIKTAQNYVTWGEASKETVNMVLARKGRLAGNRKLTDEYAQKAGYKSVEELAEAVFACKVAYWKLSKVQPVFKLHPPSKGFKGNIKKGYASGGELGYRGEKINALIKRMV
jgi:large subunit ribosomal protein L30